MRFICLVVAACLLALPARAQCSGDNLIAALPMAERDTLYASAHAEPFATGNLWQATRGDDILFLVGTYHLDDPRHDAAMQTLRPLLLQSKTLLVEAGPAEEAALQQQLATDPSTMMNSAGSGLRDALPPEDWQALTAALLQRGVPSSITEMLRPWFISMMLSIPPCALQMAADGGGLDKRLMDVAIKAAIPVKALEPFDTALGLFDAMSLDEQILMIRNALQLEPQSQDFLITTADAYAAGESRLIWEFSRHLALSIPGATAEQTQKDFDQAEQILMTNRNRAWVPVLVQAATDGPVFAGFGALHLSGKTGVLALLQAQGFTVKPYP